MGRFWEGSSDFSSDCPASLHHKAGLLTGGWLTYLAHNPQLLSAPQFK